MGLILVGVDWCCTIAVVVVDSVVGPFEDYRPVAASSAVARVPFAVDSVVESFGDCRPVVAVVSVPFDLMVDWSFAFCLHSGLVFV